MMEKTMGKTMERREPTGDQDDRLLLGQNGDLKSIRKTARYNYSSVHTMVVTRVKSYKSTASALVHHSFTSFESSHMTPIDVVGTTPLIICLSMHLFQDSHIPDVSTEFDTASGESRASSAVSPTLGQPFVLSMVVLENILCDRRRAALESVVSSNDSQASLYFCNKQGGVLFIWISVIRCYGMVSVDEVCLSAEIKVGGLKREFVS
ncbi:flocculation protein FLO11-like [Cucumis melo var. makuwa]|uniref:Flocculation protein FLO11-like n=1 Tax=Cucumis melo var. makuwa TaxID=1194695 RepID=A0A5A7V307_CUCMM|nr:flocculation protein FLO11-like [Cucumis melo var. makuwa]TYK19515.1 flocculation protein FLO11-like [Cucumis melo var. makuwa]